MSKSSALINSHNLLSLYRIFSPAVFYWWIHKLQSNLADGVAFRCIHAYNQISLLIIKLFCCRRFFTPDRAHSFALWPNHIRLTASFERMDILPKPITNLKPKNIAAANSNGIPFLRVFIFMPLLHLVCTISMYLLVPFTNFVTVLSNFLASCYCDPRPTRWKVFSMHSDKNFINILGTCRHRIFVIESKQAATFFSQNHCGRVELCWFCLAFSMPSQSKLSLSMNFRFVIAFTPDNNN